MTKSNKAKCLDCGLPYEDFGLDLLFPRGQWLAINPEDTGLLCACCMIKRAAKLPHAIVIHAVVEISLLNKDQVMNGASQGTPDSSTSADKQKTLTDNFTDADGRELPQSMSGTDLVKYFRDCMEGGQSVYNRSQRKFIEKTKSLLNQKDSFIEKLKADINDLYGEQHELENKLKEKEDEIRELKKQNKEINRIKNHFTKVCSENKKKYSDNTAILIFIQQMEESITWVNEI